VSLIFTSNEGEQRKYADTNARACINAEERQRVDDLHRSTGRLSILQQINAVFVDAHLHGSVQTVVDLDADQNLQLYVSLNDSLVGSLKACLIPCLHDQANIEQMYSKYTC